MEKEEFILSSNQNVNIKEIWQKATALICKQMSTLSFEVWVETLEPVELKGSTFVLATPSKSSKNVLLSKENVKIITSSLNEVHSAITSVEYVIGSASEELKDNEPEKTPAVEENSSTTIESSNFNPKHTFDSFVIGDSNQFVAAAAKAVAENPGKKFNPLFIYGGVGLGKTHLLHAIGNHINETNPKLKVVYVTCEKFANDLVEAIYSNKKAATADFRAKYRSVDVLMIDDIEFIIKRNTAQTEFFNTFNDLHSLGKQIILTSDRPPKELTTLEERLRSRFEWGMLADIGVPDVDTKIAILIKKAQMEHHNVSRDVIEYIASAQSSNIRDLEGMLARAVFYSELNGQSVVTLEYAKEALKNIAMQDESEIDAGSIIEHVCKFYNLKKDELLSRKRTKEIALARQVAMYLILEILGLPQDSVGSIFGKNHSTVIYARDTITEMIKKDKKFATNIEDIKAMVKGK